MGVIQKKKSVPQRIPVKITKKLQKKTVRGINLCVTPCAAETCAVRPVFGRVVGKLGAADPRIYPKGRESKC